MNGVAEEIVCDVLSLGLQERQFARVFIADIGIIFHEIPVGLLFIYLHHYVCKDTFGRGYDGWEDGEGDEGMEERSVQKPPAHPEER